MQMNESWQHGHFRYPYTMHKKEERGKTQWEETPLSKYNAKVEKRQLLGNRVLHPKMISQESKLLLSESLGEDISNLLETRTILKIDDPIMNEFSNEVHVNLDVFGPLPLHWISTKL